MTFLYALLRLCALGEFLAKRQNCKSSKEEFQFLNPC